MDNKSFCLVICTTIAGLAGSVFAPTLRAQDRKASSAVSTAPKSHRETEYAALQSKDPLLRLEAVLRLGDHEFGEDAVPLLCSLLVNDKNELVRRATAQVFCVQEYCFDYVAVRDLAKALRDPSPSVQIRAAIAVGNRLDLLDDRVDSDLKEPKLLAQLREVKNQLRQDQSRAVRGLLDLGLRNRFPKDAPGRDIKAVMPLLFAALETEERTPLPFDSDGQCRSRLSLISLFGVVGPDAAIAVPLVLKELAGMKRIPTGICNQDDLETDRCDSVVSTLVGIGCPAVPELEKALASGNPVLRHSAALALARIDHQNPKSLPVLLESLHGKCWGECCYVFVRADAAALAAMGHHALPSLLAAIGREDGCRPVAGGPRAALRENILQALARMDADATAVVPLLVQNLDAPAASVRSIAATGLGFMGKRAAASLPALEKASRDKTPEVRENAIQAIQQIKKALSHQ